MEVHKTLYPFYTTKKLPNVTAKVANSVPSKTVFLKVGGIAPLGAILMGKGAKTPKGPIGERKNIKGAKMLNH